MLHNKATNAKLGSTNYLATQTKHVTNKLTQTKLVTQRELLLYYASKKVISKLHKLTN
jgi:hypothetical protein